MYDEGAEITPDSLMRDAENKYKTLLQEDRWNAMSAEQSQIIALSAQVRKLTDGRVKLSGKNNKNKKGKDEDKSPAKAKTGKGKNKRGKKRGKAKSNDKWAWKRVPPKDGDGDEKLVNDVKYYWCPHHSLWTLTRHTDENCEVIKKRKNEAASEGISEMANKVHKIPDSASNKSSPPSLSFAAKLHDIMNE